MEEGRFEWQEDDDGTLMSRLVGGMIEGKISEEEVVDNAVLLAFAAHDTTSYAIAMTFRMLAHHPHCYSLLVQGTYNFQTFLMAFLQVSERYEFHKHTDTGVISR
jgi:cytochrome P450